MTELEYLNILHLKVMIRKKTDIIKKNQYR